MVPYVPDATLNLSYLEKLLKEMDSLTGPNGLALKNAPFSFSRVSDEAEKMRIMMRNVIETEAKLDKEAAISLVFLLAGDVSQALRICTWIERETPPFVTDDKLSVGQKVLVMFLQTMKKQSLQRANISIICALHLLRKYKTIRFLTNLSLESTKQHFNGREHLFLDGFRVRLYIVAQGLIRKNSQLLLMNVECDFGLNEAHYAFSTLETNLLLLMVEKRLHPGEPISKLAKCLPDECEDLRKHLPIIEIRPNANVLKKGFCFILNQSNFTHPDYPHRAGSDLDEKELFEVWKRFGPCDVEVERDKTGAEMKNIFKNLSKRDFSRFDFFVLVLMSHGRRANETDFILGTDGAGVRLKHDICRLFNECSSLRGKMKLYLVQACRGFEGQGGLAVVGDGPSSGSAPPQDYMIFYSTVEGNSALRVCTEGTYFLQTFCREMKENGGHMPVRDILDSVMEHVKGVTGVQQPAQEVTFGKRVFFQDTRNPTDL